MRKWLLRWIRKLAAAFGAAVISRAHYEALVLGRLTHERGGATHSEGSSERPDALESGDAYRLPPPVPFPELSGISPDTFAVSIVDVGAQPLASEQDIYMPLVRSGACQVVGFDPFTDPDLDNLNEHKVPLEPQEKSLTSVTILPYFIGNGSKAQFHVNAFSPTSSLFPSNLKLMNEFSGLAEICLTRSVIEVTTRRLDDVSEIGSCDLLKIDVQGGDFDVIAHGRGVLDKTLFVHIEAEFAEIYAGQPLFSDIDVLLRERNFEFVDFVKLGRSNYKAFPSPSLRSRLLWSDCIYMKNPADIAARNPRLLLRAAYVAHVNYRKYDLSAHLIALHDRLVGTSLCGSYVAATNQRLLQALEPTRS
jgi:FkbM family methyltransferase